MTQIAAEDSRGSSQTQKENSPTRSTWICAGSPFQEPEIDPESLLVCPSSEPEKELETFAMHRETESVLRIRR
ncbi:MAG: hypothetical protein MI919_07850, partial [Holophagales bacterium]|nr:hypothetical protein [Holophagales bacterium]